MTRRSRVFDAPLKSIEIIPRAQYFLASALALLGRLEEARSARLERLWRSTQTSPSRASARAQGADNPRYLAARERVSDGMRKAGVPEG